MGTIRLIQEAFRPAPRIAGMLLTLILLSVRTAVAAPSYHISFERSGYGQQYVATQGTPFDHAASYPIPGGVNSTFTGSAFAYPGHVGLRNHAETLWTGPNNSTRYDVYSYATANDFVITGPPATQITGQLHLRVRARLEHVSGFAGNSAHGARLNVDARARFGQFVAMGDLMANNNSTYGTGILTGQNDPDLDFAFVLQGNFPVGTPFDVYMRIFGIETTYGNGGSTPNPGYAETNASRTSLDGLFLEEVGGQVMTLPAGYTLNSTSWGVVDNHFHSTVGVEPAIESGTLQLSLSPNPAAAEVRVTLTLPNAATARVAVFDLAGRRVRVLAEGERQAGRSDLVWDGRMENGGMAEPGLYFARAEVGGQIVSRRIVRVR